MSTNICSNYFCHTIMVNSHCRSTIVQRHALETSHVRLVYKSLCVCVCVSTGALSAYVGVLTGNCRKSPPSQPRPATFHTFNFPRPPSAVLRQYRKANKVHKGRKQEFLYGFFCFALCKSPVANSAEGVLDSPCCPLLPPSLEYSRPRKIPPSLFPNSRRYRL